MNRAALAVLLLALGGCATPTLAQRQANWEKFVSVTRAECVVGSADPAMPGDVRTWCSKVTDP